jgi:hypothetical protein
MGPRRIMSDLADSQVSEEATEASDAQPEVDGGSEHFSIGEGPPGADSLEPTPSEPDAEASEAETTEVAAETVAPEQFWSFKTADGSEKTFGTAEEAQQFFSSWNGRLSKTERDYREAEAANLAWQRAYEDGSLFKTKEGAGVDAKAEEPKSSDEANYLKSVDWTYVNKLLGEGTPDKALQYIAYKNGEYLKKTVEDLRTEVTGSIDGLTAPQRFAQETGAAMTYVAEAGYKAVDDMGQPLFPEFQSGDAYDKAFVHHFRDIWMNQDVQLACDPNLTGFKAAYYEAKATYRPAAPETAPPPTPAAAPTPPPAPRNPDGTFAKRTQALAMGGSDPQGHSVTGRTQTREEYLLDGMRNANKPRSDHFAVVPD